MAHSVQSWFETQIYWVRIPVGGIFVIEFVHIQCSKLFKGLECVVLSVVLCTGLPRNLKKSFIGMVKLKAFKCLENQGFVS